jgi:hypothetical protein
MATEEINLNVNSNIKSVTKDTADLKKEVSGVKKETKSLSKATKEGKKGWIATNLSAKALGLTLKGMGIGLIVSAIAMLTAAFYKNKKVAAEVTKVMNTVSNAATDIIDVFVETAVWVSESSARFNGLAKVLGGMITMQLTPLKLAFYGLKISVQSLLLSWERSPLGGGDPGRIKELQDGIRQTGRDILDVGKNAVQAGKDIYNNIGDAIGEVNDIYNVLETSFSKFKLDDKTRGEKTQAVKDEMTDLEKFMLALNERTAQAEADTDEKKIEREREKHIAELDKLEVNADEKAILKEQLNKLYDDQLTEIQIQREKDSAEVMSNLKEENALADIELERTKAQEILKLQYDKDKLALEGMESQGELEKELEEKFLREKQEITDEYDEQDLEKAKKLQAAKVEMLQQGLSVIQSMMDLQSTQIEKDYSNEIEMAEGNAQDIEKIEEKFEEKRREQAKKMKAMKIAMALVDTYQSAVSAYSAALQMGLPGLALAPVSAGLAIAAGLANVAMIEKQPLGGSGGGGASAGGTSSMPPAPEMMSGAFELGGGQPVEPARAYVVSDDITNNQNKLAIIRRRATI